MDIIEKCKKEQLKLSKLVTLKDRYKKITSIAASAQVLTEDQIITSIVVFDFPSLNIIEKQTTKSIVKEKYNPNFIAYRQIPSLIETFSKLKKTPQVLLIEGNGICHPRRCGIATHTALLLDIPTIGVSKSLIVGKVRNGKIYIAKEMVGFQIITKEHAKPIYVSPGCYISFGNTLNIIEKTIKGEHKMPEPIHIAKKIAKKLLQDE